jgi:nucleoside-diphosphate-sugar epimerase
MKKHPLVIGAGPTGTLTARLLASSGRQVRIVSRRGGGELSSHVEHMAANASDADQLIRLAHGAETIINCAMPSYDRWPEEFPAINSAVLRAAEAAGADVVTLSNVYGYGHVSTPMLEDLPLQPHTVKGRVRAGMWDLAKRSSVRVTEVRASDYLGHGAVTLFSLFVLPGILAARPAAFPGDIDAPHSWSYTKDVARTLVAAAESSDSWGRAWHVPSNIATVRDLAAAAAAIAEVAAPSLSRVPNSQVQELAADDRMMREVAEMTYLFEASYILDSQEPQRVLGVSAATLDEALRDTLGKASRR